MVQLTNIWKDRAISKDLKLKLLRALISPALMYGSEGWTLRKEEEDKINSAEMWIYRRMPRVS